MSKASYTISKTEKSRCPTCDQTVNLLMDEEGLCETELLPAFYICFKCEFVGQIGLGPVSSVPEKKITRIS